MSKEKFIDLVTKELTGELSGDEHQELQTLIKSNPFFARQRSSFRMYWANDHADESDDVAMFQRITERIREQDVDFNVEKVVPLKKYFFSYGWKAAAAILIISCSLIFYNIAIKSIVNKSDTQVVKTLRGEKKKLTLPDGTKVTINADSKLSFPSSFKDSTREVSLIGEAFFDVHEDHNQPFIIHTRKMDIRVLGTAFNVKAYQEDKFSETTLIRGSIQVKLADRPSDRITLKPTEKLVVNYSAPDIKGTKAVLQKHIDLPEVTSLQKKDTTVVETSWLQNKLIFKNQELESIANSLERRYDVSIQFENDAIKELRFTGFFEKESIAEVLNSLQLIESFKYRILKDKIMIY